MPKNNKKKQAEDVTLQIPVSRGLADELARWAKKMDLTQAKLSKALLSFAMESPENIGEWLTERAIGKRRKHIKAGWLLDGNNSEVRLAVRMDEALAKEIEEMAVRLNHSPVRLAALLLDFSLADEKWGLAFFSWWPGRMMLLLLGKVPDEYESAEIEEEE